MKIMFAENLRNFRTTKKISQSELAKMVGVDRRTVSAWENKICEPSYDTLLKLCEIFDETLDNLLT